MANLLYAQSVVGRTPSTFLSWFQAARACRASGKRLPTHDEWLEAAAGTPDPGSSTGTGAGVLSMNLSNGPVATNWNIGFRCVIPR